MCTFIDDRAFLVCDVAIAHVRDEVEGSFQNGVSYTVRHGEGTLVQGDASVDPKTFGDAVRAGMTRAEVQPEGA
jgi:hypothetical protein